MVYELSAVVTMNDLQSSSSCNEFFSDGQLCQFGVNVQHFRYSLQNGEIYSYWHSRLPEKISAHSDTEMFNYYHRYHHVNARINKLFPKQL
jgi:hypothetical protein